MATNEKISQLPYRDPAQANDRLVVDRSGDSAQISAGSIGALTPNSGVTQIVSSAVSAGNPAFLSAGGVVPTGINVNILGATTPLVYFIKGTKQTLTSDVPLTLPTIAGEQLRFIFASKTSNPYVTQVDFSSSAVIPFFTYTIPTAPTGTGPNNPAYWFDMSTNSCWKAVAPGTTFSQVTDLILLGVVMMNASTAIRAVLCEPFRLDHAKRLQLFGDGSNGSAPFGNLLVVTGSSVIPFGVNFARGGSISGGTLSHNATNNDIGAIIYSQTPVIITNSGKFGASGKGCGGGAGTANATGTAGTGGSLGATGAGGGGGVANTGGAGGAQAVPARLAITNAGGGGGTAGNVGTNGAAPITTRVTLPSGLTVFMVMLGGGGGGGAAQAASTGGSGGSGGGNHILIAPAILLDTGCTATSQGADGGAGTGTNAAGGGGGGGGCVVLAGGYVINSGTVTAAGGAAGTKLGAGTGNGGVGGTGIAQVIKLW